MKLLIAFLFPITLFAQEFKYSIHNCDLALSPVIGYSYATKSFKVAPSQLNLGGKLLYRFNKDFGLSLTGEAYLPIGKKDVSLIIENKGVLHYGDSGYAIVNVKTDFELSLAKFNFYRPTLQIGLGYSTLSVDSISKGAISLDVGVVNYFALGRRMAGFEVVYTRTPFRSGLGDDINGGLLGIKFTYYFGTLYFTRGL